MHLLDLVVDWTSLVLLCNYRKVELVIKTSFLRVQPTLLPNLQVTAASKLPLDPIGARLAPTMTNVFALQAPPITFRLKLARLKRVVRRLLVTLLTGTCDLQKLPLLAQLHILDEEWILGNSASGTVSKLRTLLLYPRLQTPNSTAWSVPEILAMRIPPLASP